MLARCHLFASRRSTDLRFHAQRHRLLSQWIQVPLIFTGLLATLWTWKSLTLIVLQNKIIYMPYLGRHERLEDYPTPGVTWTRECLRSPDGVRLVLLRSQLDDCARQPVRLAGAAGKAGAPSGRTEKKKRRHQGQRRRKIKVLYLQGNASSSPPRLPALSKILRLAHAAAEEDDEVEFFVLSYRGFWESSGRPSEPGILCDVCEALRYIVAPAETDPQNHVCDPRARDDAAVQQEKVEVVVWGHSIGASFAVLALPHLLRLCHATTMHKVDNRKQHGRDGTNDKNSLERNDSRVGERRCRSIKLILETPFPSTMSVLRALYPQPWLPYRYLSPFLRTRLDLQASLAALTTATTRKTTIADATTARAGPYNVADKTWMSEAPLEVLVIKAERDEIVPAHASDAVTQLLRDHGGSSSSSTVTEHVVRGALHQDCLFKAELQNRVVDFITQ